MNEQLKIIISAEVDKLKKGVQDAKQEVGNFKQQVQEASKNIDINFKKVGEGIKNAAKKIAVGVAGAGTALLALGASTKDYRAEQAKLNSAFETAGASADTAKQVYNDLYRVLGESDTSVEAANHLAQLTTNQKDLSEWTNICQGIYATFGDSLPIEGLTEAANETAKTASVTGSLADALNWAGISEDDFNAQLAACNSEAEREQLIRKTLIGTYNEAAAAYEKNAAEVLKQNEAQAKLQDSLAKLGAVVAPIVTIFTQFATEALAVVVPYIQQLAEQYGPQLKEVLQGIGEFIKPIGEFLMAHLPAIATIAGIIMGIAAAYQVVSAALTVYNTIKTAYTTITTIATAAQTAFAAANIAALAPILAVVAAIAAVVAIIVVCIKHWDKIKEAVSKAWDFIKEKTKAAVDAVVNLFNNLKESVSNIVNNVKSAVSEKFNAIKDTMGNIMGAAKEVVSEKLNNIKDAYNEHGGGIKGIAAAAMEGVKGYYTAGYSFINKLTGGKLQEVANTMRNKMNAAKETVSNILEAIKDKFNSIFEGAKNIVKNAIEKIKGFFDFKWELPKIKLPHFSISGKFSLNPPQIPKFSVSWYKLGGVFDSPTLFPYGGSIGGLGEDGAEAVVPLEKNTQWLDRIAEKLASKQSSTPVILQVDGKTWATTTIKTVNELTKQTGTLGLVLV